MLLFFKFIVSFSHLGPYFLAHTIDHLCKHFSFYPSSSSAYFTCCLWLMLVAIVVVDQMPRRCCYCLYSNRWHMLVDRTVVEPLMTVLLMVQQHPDLALTWLLDKMAVAVVSYFGQ